MRILLLTHAFNSLTQRLYLELSARGHALSIEFDIADSVTEEAVAMWQPDVVIAPFLKRAIPASIWTQTACLIVHPGIVGDRGPSALDWAIQEDQPGWGVTVLQANAEMDGGDIWATSIFHMRSVKKSSLYRNEVTEAAVTATLDALAHFPRFKTGLWKPIPLIALAMDRPRPQMRQPDRQIDWQLDSTAEVLRKIAAADGVPGVLDQLFEQPCYLHDAHAVANFCGLPGDLIGQAGHGVVRATADGAVWIGHVRRLNAEWDFKLPLSDVFSNEMARLPVLDVPEAQPIRYEEEGDVGFLYFDFYNGAMSTQHCRQLLQAYQKALARPTSVLVLMGGEDFWSNGIHLNRIEAATSPADESLRNIEAMDDLSLAVLQSTEKLLVSAMQGNAGAGGCFLALAADEVWARCGVVLNPHYKNMGNLFGSEYWTYLLPKRIGHLAAQQFMQNRLPLLATTAAQIGLIDVAFGSDLTSFRQGVKMRAHALAQAHDFELRIIKKQYLRKTHEAHKPLAAYREQELREMRKNFYGFDPSYHYARQHFVSKVAHAWTPRHLARHREAENVVQLQGQL